MEYNYFHHAVTILATCVLFEVAILGVFYARTRVVQNGTYDRLAVAVYDWNVRFATHGFVVWQMAVIGTYFAIFGRA